MRVCAVLFTFCQRQTDLGFRLTRRRSVGHRDVINHTKPILESSKSGRTRRPKGGVSLEKSFRSKLFPLFWFSGCCCYHFFSFFFLCVCLIVCLYICLFVLQYVSFEMLRFSTDVQELCPIACIHFHIDIPIVSRLVN